MSWFHPNITISGCFDSGDQIEELYHDVSDPVADGLDKVAMIYYISGAIVTVNALYRSGKLLCAMVKNCRDCRDKRARDIEMRLMDEDDSSRIDAPRAVVKAPRYSRLVERDYLQDGLDILSLLAVSGAIFTHAGTYSYVSSQLSDKNIEKMTNETVDQCDGFFNGVISTIVKKLFGQVMPEFTREILNKIPDLPTIPPISPIPPIPKVPPAPALPTNIPIIPTLPNDFGVGD